MIAWLAILLPISLILIGASLAYRNIIWGEVKMRRRRWIQKAIKRPGRVRKYIRRKYGRKAFTKDGEIKQQYIHKAIRELKERPPSRRPKGLLQALQLAKRLETMRKGK